MKTFLLLFASAMFTLSTYNISDAPLTNDIFEETLTFDGYEGDYFFFTNTEDKSIVLAMDENTIFGTIPLTENEDIKNQFTVTYKFTLTDDDTSSSGVLIKAVPND